MENNIRELYDPQEVLGSAKIRNNTIRGTVMGEPGDRTLFVRVKEGELEWWRPVSIEVIVPHSATNGFNWELAEEDAHYETVDMDAYMNASVDQIFTNEYLSPRSPFTTLQIPRQGIGEWCHPALTAAIDDSGLRKASREGVFETPFGIPFRTPSDESPNIAFTSLWDNYPSSVTIPLEGNASHAFLLMAGSTNHMQVHVPNGEVLVTYRDGSQSRLELRNPETWVPIEQDLFVDDHAFRLSNPRPYRVGLKSGKVSRNFDDEIPADEVYGRSIDGGAAIILDLPLEKEKELESITVRTIANEVVIGLMSVTLAR
jgi:hypothetical protein